MRLGKRISVIIPALNEARAIARVIADIPSWVDEVVVADNGSTDATAEIARSNGARVVTERQRGYGAACLAGIASCPATDILVFLDGDYSDYPDEMERLVDPVARGDCDLVIGSRITGAAQTRALTLQQRVGNWIACKLTNAFWKSCYTDLGPFRAVNARALRRLGMRDRTYGWTVEMQIKAAIAGLPVREVPVSYRARIGESKISGTLKGTVLAGVKIIALITRFAVMPRQLNS